MIAVAKIPGRMTVEEFLLWETGDDWRYELVDGEPLAMAPASNTHALLQSELARLIGNHLRTKSSLCDVLTNPGVVPHLLSDHNFRIPDLAVTCSPLPPGPSTVPDPVLLVEILSPSNQAKTWANVRAYTSIGSVQEILILRTDRTAAELLRRLPAGDWPERPTVIVGGTLELGSIAFTVALSELYGRTGLIR